MAHNAALVRMDRAADDRAQVPDWLPQSFIKQDGAPDVAFQGYQYFVFPMDHNEFSRTGVIGNPMTATAEKGEQALERFADHLVAAIDEFRPLETEHHAAGVRGPRLSPAVPPALRRAQILERIRREGGVTVAELATSHDVSSITVHRDLAELASGGPDRARARRRPGRRRRGGRRADRDGLGQPSGPGQRGQGGDRPARRAADHRQRHDLPRLLVHLPGARRARSRPTRRTWSRS